MDLYSRKVIGWSMKATMAKEIVIDSLMGEETQEMK
jgi:transposase InsO family protein